MNWIIPDKVFKMSETQLNFFRMFYKNGNWREVKKFNENEIGYAKALPGEDGGLWLLYLIFLLTLTKQMLKKSHLKKKRRKINWI